jgi:hypothetical protein
MRVVLRSGDTLIVRGPVITGDSLTGLRTKPGASADSLERVGVPLGAIDHAEAPMFDVAGLILTALGFAAFVVIMKAALRCILWCPGTGPMARSTPCGPHWTGHPLRGANRLFDDVEARGCRRPVHRPVTGCRRGV